MAAIHNFYLTHFYLDKPPTQLTDSEKLELIRKCKNFKEVKELLSKEEPNYYKELIQTYEGSKNRIYDYVSRKRSEKTWRN